MSANAFSEWQPDTSNELDLRVQAALLKIKESDPGLQAWFDSAAGFAIFPRVGKGGIGIGGARGTGLVISGGETLAETTMTQVTIGFQLGGQVYIELIFFKDDVALETFMRGEFEMGAQASAVAATAGASATTSYSKGVAVFTLGEGGLMYEASVGGQKFKIDRR
jgi:lipid-binding SYLF domain-containing protein